MRKPLMVAAAVVAAAGGPAAAVAQTPGATMTVSVSPSKLCISKCLLRSAPAQSTTVTNTDSKKTAKQIDNFMAKAIRFSAKGLRTCRATNEQIIATSGRACARSKVGSGVAKALAGVNTTSPTPLTFKVTAFLTGAKSLAFLLKGQELTINLVAPAKVSRASGAFGTKLSVKVPPQAQQLPPGTFNGLVSLTTTLGSKRLLTTTACRGKQHPFKTVISFSPNPNPPSPASVTATASAPCT